MRRTGWAWALAIEALALLTINVLCVLLVPLLPEAGRYYALAHWALLPLWGAVCAYRATRRGLNNYLAWAPPPLLMAGVYWALTGLPPLYPGAVLLCAGLALVGAAAGEVQNVRMAKR